MYEHSRDILNLTLSSCAAILTLLLAWLLVYCIRVMKTLVNLSRRINETIRLTEETLTTLRDPAPDPAGCSQGHGRGRAGGGAVVGGAA